MMIVTIVINLKRLFWLLNQGGLVLGRRKLRKVEDLGHSIIQGLIKVVKHVDLLVGQIKQLSLNKVGVMAVHTGLTMRSPLKI